MNKFHIAFGVDDGFIRPAGVCITSILECNKKINFAFHIFSNGVSNDSLRRLKELESTYQTEIIVHIIDHEYLNDFKDIKIPPHLSLAAYIRIFIPEVLKHITDKVLYLDADILCRGDISTLINMDINDDIVGVIQDIEVDLGSPPCEQLGLSNGKYFNSGVLYINIKNWIDSNITQSVIDASTDEARGGLCDQKALNVVLDGRAKFIEKKWNFQYPLGNALTEGKDGISLPNDVVFIHYIGKRKPWHSWNLIETKTFYLSYQNISPWKDIDLEEPKIDGYREMRRFSRYLIKQGSIVDGLTWYCRYLTSKYVYH